MGLGSADIVDLRTARRRALEQRQLLEQGVDPLEKRRQDEAEDLAQRQNAKTFDQCVEEYLRLHESNWRNPKHRSQWKNTLDDLASPIFGSTEVSKVTKEKIIQCLKKAWSIKPETASRTLQRIVKVLIWAGAKGYRDVVDSSLRHTVAAALGPQARQVQHMASCEYSQVNTIIRQVMSSDVMTNVRYAFEFTVLTAARSGETRGAVWSEFDLEKRIWSIPGERMKAGQPHEVPLSERAVQLLRFVAPNDGNLSALVFPGRKGQPLSDMVFTQLLRRLKTTYTMHGFRSSFRVWASERTDYTPEVCEAALAHARGNAVERAYNRTNLLEKRVPLMNDWAEYIQKSKDADAPK